VLKSQMKELLEAEAAKARDITEEIEEARAKVEAKTPITQEVRGGGLGGLHCCEGMREPSPGVGS
jgi:hypothetical protein